jgi:hypothetical protein
MVKKLNFSNFIVFYLIISTGAISLGKNESFIVGLFTVFLLANYIIKKKKIIFTRKSLTIILFTFFCILFSTLINVASFEGGASNFILGFSLKIINAILVINLLSFNTFIIKYIKQIFVLSSFSLFFYFTLLVYPGLINFLPKLPSIDPYQYNFLIYVYEVPRFSVFPRNMSIFYEPGVFQGLIVVAVLFLKFLNINTKKLYKYYFIFLVALLTTFSTTAYICIIGIILIKLKEFKNSKLISVVLIIIMSLAFSLGLFNIVLQNKLQDPKSSVSSLRRFTDVQIETKMFLEKPFFGYGYDYFTVKKQELDKSDSVEVWTGSTNSITYHLALFGILFMIPIFVGYYILIKQIDKGYVNQIILYFIIIIVLMGETFLQKMLFLVLCYYPFGLLNQRKKSIN